MGEFLLVPAYLGSPGSMAVKQLRVCVCVLIYSQATVITREQMILTMTYNVHLHRMIKLNSS